MAERTAHNTFTVSILAGLAGAGLALLFAPRSGVETRARLKSKTAELKAQADEKLDMGKEKAQGFKEKLESVVSKATRRSKEEAEELGDAINRKTDRQSPVISAWNEEV